MNYEQEVINVNAKSKQYEDQINEEMDKILYRASSMDDSVLPINEIASKKEISQDRYSCGLEVFDNAMKGGFKNGDLVIISGISGEGKTLYAQTLTYNFTKLGISCLWFSYEVSIQELDRQFTEMGMLDHYNAYAPKKNITGKLEWIKDKIKEGWKKYACKIVFIDHIDFLTPTDIKTSDNETIALKKITTELKQLAIELDIVIIVMAHLKKIQDGKEPEMQDIGYSAGIFQLADYVFMIFREKLKQHKNFSGYEQAGNINTNNSIIKLVKNRQTGQNKFIKVVYNNGKLIPLTDFYENQDNPAVSQ